MSFKLFLYKYETGYICISESEKNDLEVILGDISNDLILVDSEDSFKKCIENRDFKKSNTCIESNLKVNNFIKNQLYTKNKYIYMSDFAYDIEIRPQKEFSSGYIFPVLISRNENILNIIESNPIKYILKVRIEYDDHDGHMFLIVVNIYKNKVSSIDIIDTGPITYDNNAIKKLIIFNFFRSKYDLDDNFYINYPILDFESPTYLQKMEKNLTNSGYCVAWVLFFIWYKFVQNIDFDIIYEKLFSLNDIERVILIMLFYDNIIRDLIPFDIFYEENIDNSVIDNIDDDMDIF